MGSVLEMLDSIYFIYRSVFFYINMLRVELYVSLVSILVCISLVVRNSRLSLHSCQPLWSGGGVVCELDLGGVLGSRWAWQTARLTATSSSFAVIVWILWLSIMTVEGNAD